MDLINLKTISKTISATKLKQSLKVAIRDVDEESKNNFVAYADDKGVSYDVAIEIDENDDVLENNCDCEIKGLCIHRVAFLVYLSNRKDKPKVVRAKKQTPTEILVNNLDVNVLKVWINDLLKKNKDLEFLFTTEFSINTEEYTKQKVKSLIDSSIKSVIKTRKKIESSELKKITDLLEITLKPVVEFCLNDLTNKDKLDIAFSIFNELLDFDRRMYNSSIKIIRFIEKLSKTIVESVSNNNDDVKFQKITDLHFELILNEDISRINSLNFNHFQLLYEKNSENEFRKKYFANKIQNFIGNSHSKKIKFDVQITFFALEVLFENGLFESSIDCFQAVRYENAYNLSLIDKLISINKIKEAEEMASAQIASNYYIDYNFPYWQRLKPIYITQKQDLKLANILINTVPIDLNFDDYLIVKKAMPEKDFKQYRSNLLGKTKRGFHSVSGATNFYFKLLAEENNYKKMLETISEHTDYDLVFEYKSQLYKEEKIQFLKSICQIQSNDYFRRKQFNEEYRDKLVDWVFENYDMTILASFIKTYSNRLDSVFLSLLIFKIT